MTVSVASDTRLGEAWVQALRAGDESAVLAVVGTPVDFGALTPGATWEASTASEVSAIVLARWFAGPRRIESLESIDHGSLGGVQRVGYQFRVATPDGDAVIEQQAYFSTSGGRITWMRLLCSGFRPWVDHGE